MGKAHRGFFDLRDGVPESERAGDFGGKKNDGGGRESKRDHRLSGWNPCFFAEQGEGDASDDVVGLRTQAEKNLGFCLELAELSWCGIL